VIKPKRKRPSDSNQLAHSVLQDVIGLADPKPAKNPAAVALGRLGGLKGGKARAANLSARKRKEIARKAAKSRWLKK
jgi:hypothetical protein